MVELRGRHRLLEALALDRIEVALPVRDRGVDLIVYDDADARSGSFRAWPVQLKASSLRSFAIDKKYARCPHLFLVYVWCLARAGHEEIYALRYSEAVEVGNAMGYTQTSSWIDKGKYVSTRPSRKLLTHLAPFRMIAGNWRKLLFAEID